MNAVNDPVLHPRDTGSPLLNEICVRNGLLPFLKANDAFLANYTMIELLGLSLDDFELFPHTNHSFFVIKDYIDNKIIPFVDGMAKHHLETTVQQNNYYFQELSAYKNDP